MVSSKRAWIVRSVTVALLAIGAIWFWIDSRLPTYRFELAVEVDTPQGLRIGSSVIEVRTRREPRLLPDMSGQSERLIGEAVLVDLPGGQRLYATLKTETADDADTIAAETLLPYPARGALSLKETLSRLARPGQEGVVPRNAYPLLVRFRTAGDPASVEGLDPDNLAAAFGPGVSLRRIIVRTTSSPPTFRNADAAPWLAGGFHIWARASNGITMDLRRDAFRRE